MKTNEKQLVVIDDTATEIGGAGRTLFSFLDGIDNHIVFNTQAVNGDLLNSVKSDAVFLIGNCHALTKENWPILDFIFSTKTFAKIEFDYGFCVYRSERGFQKFTGENKWEPFGEFGNKFLEEMYRKICFRAEHHFFMSQKQMDIHRSFLPVRDDAEVISSCFYEKDFDFMGDVREKRKTLGVKNPNRWAIIDGNGGWHTEAKGVYEAIRYCKESGREFDVVGGFLPYEELLLKIAEYEGLVFLPIIHDTCPRVVIEAALMGLNVMVNDNCQHYDEDWFSEQNPSEIREYLRGRKAHFQDAMIRMMDSED